MKTQQKIGPSSDISHVYLHVSTDIPKTRVDGERKEATRSAKGIECSMAIEWFTRVLGTYKQEGGFKVGAVRIYRE